MRHVNLAGTWKKRLAASLLPLSLLLAMAAGGMPQGAQQPRNKQQCRQGKEPTGWQENRAP